MSLRVVLHPAAERELKILHRNREDFKRIVGAVNRFAETGRGDVRVVASSGGPEEILMVLRVGSWRIHFGVIREVMYVVGIEKRSKAYQPWIIEAAKRRLRRLGIGME
ncbi:MAG: hypothetical protein QW179_03470 [Candidatus Hadarchaeales archaeon]